MQAFTDANNAAVQAAKDIRDLVDGRDETDLWDKSEEGILDGLMVTLTIKRRARDEMWKTLIMTNLERCDDDEFLLAIDDLQIYKGYADIMINRASHVAKRSIVIIRLQSAKQRGRQVIERTNEAEEISGSPEAVIASTNRRDEMVAEAPTKGESGGRREENRNSGKATQRGSSEEAEEMSPADGNDISPAEGTREKNRAKNVEGVASHKPPGKNRGGRDGEKEKITIEDPVNEAPEACDEREENSGKPAILDESRGLAVAKSRQRKFEDGKQTPEKSDDEKEARPNGTENMAFEITPDQENWCPTEIDDAVDDDDEAYKDWKAGEIEYGQ